MEENFDALEVIARTRGKVEMDSVPTGDYLFVLWGGISAFFYLLEFILWQVIGQPWCLWLWIGIPLLGVPWMVVLVRRDHERTHVRSRESKLVLDYWIFAGAACFIGGFALDFAGVYTICFLPIVSLLLGIGSFITGEAARFRPMIICGLIGAAVGIGAFALQGEIWPWQLLAISVVAAIALIIPGILYHKQYQNGV